MQPQITVEVIVPEEKSKVWAAWTLPEHVTRWCFASDDWCAPRAENDLQVGGKFVTRMEAKDGSAGFDFGGEYTAVDPESRIEYVMEDGRKVSITFERVENGCRVIEMFDPENENPTEMQRSGWQSILENFKRYVVDEMK
ncbi:MAG: SRPBCC family protein [Undibacterium sp.]